jgi:hypothetical protein
MKENATPIHFAGSQLRETRHVCAFFNSDDEKYRVLLPFIKDGFDCLAKNPFFVPPDEFLGELRERRTGQAKPPAPAI